MKNIRFILQIGLCALLSVSSVSRAENSSAGVDSPAFKAGHLVFISGQGAGSTKNAHLIERQIQDAFKKLSAVAKESGGSLNEIVKINVYLTDLADYPLLNQAMRQYFKKPYPARSTVGVAMLPKDHRIEIDAVMHIH